MSTSKENKKELTNMVAIYLSSVRSLVRSHPAAGTARDKDRAPHRTKCGARAREPGGRTRRGGEGSRTSKRDMPSLRGPLTARHRFYTHPHRPLAPAQDI